MNGSVAAKPSSTGSLIESLMDEAAYPHSVDGPIELHETHISWVLLAGHFAYKIKKPLRTDFLDYSTLEKRHRACCEELRLDSRYAEDLYLDVVPIAMEDGQVKMDGDSQPIEFAVRMRRFAPSSLLSDRLQSREVTVEGMVQLAEKLAGFHRRADVYREESEDVVDEIRRQACENFEAFDGIELAEARGEIDAVRRWSDDRFEKHQSLFRRRVRQGFVRECHGDLHCDNIVEWRGGWVPFDGIEFNWRFSRIDVMSDIAFLAMDLRARDRADLSAILLNAYLEQTGDYEGLALLPWYMVYRAMVRAKVALIRRQQSTLDEAERQAQNFEIAKRIKLAKRLTEPMDRQLWITHGVSGSGKTTGSLRWVSLHGAVRVRSDVERKRLYGTRQDAEGQQGIDEGIYSATASAATYQRLWTTADTILEAGFSVVVDATFLRRADRASFRSLAQQKNLPFHILDFRAEETTLRQRVVARYQARKDASDANLLVLERQLRDQEPLDDDEKRLIELPSESGVG